MEKEKYLNRTSVRRFTGEKMKAEDLKLLRQIINSSPTSTNTHQFSAIIIEDQEMLDWIAVNNWNQVFIKGSSAFIVFIADRTRVNYIKDEFKVDETRDMKNHEFVRGIVDATIGCTNAMNAAIEMGYGTTVVGGVLAYSDKLKEKLNIPEENKIVVGLAIGVKAAQNAIKGKLDKTFLEKYDKDVAIKEVERYQVDTMEEMSQRGRASWKERTAQMADGKDASNESFAIAGRLIDKEYKNFK